MIALLVGAPVKNREMSELAEFIAAMPKIVSFIGYRGIGVELTGRMRPEE